MERPNDRHYEIRSVLLTYIVSTVIPKCESIAVQDAMERLNVRFGALSEEESEEVQNMLYFLGWEIEKLASERRHESEKRWRAYQQGYDDGKKSV